jgi:protein arginine kinase activator
MQCQNCQKNAAKVHVTDIAPPESSEGAGSAVVEQHFCEVCAESLDLPSLPASKKSPQDIWKLLQIAAQQTRKKPGPACPQCGMTLDEFRKKGRLGCAKDYEVFKGHILEILERVHGARQHVGRLPGGEQAGPEERNRLVVLRRELETAIREEAYERAAHLRDEIKAIEETRSS